MDAATAGLREKRPRASRLKGWRLDSSIEEGFLASLGMKVKSRHEIR